jgi:DNA replication initiation complex subunit (GINS family)
MLTYQDLYEFVRKEKFGETLQPLPKKFVEQVSAYLQEKRAEGSQEGDLFLDSVGEAKKQLENAIALFKELMLRRKKKILHLVFVAAETGIMKRDYEQMLGFEKEMFDGLVKAVETGDRVMQERLQGKVSKGEDKGSGQRMILFEQEAEEFVDAEGKSIGPFAAGELANLEEGVASVLVDGGKASFVDSEN